MIGVSKDTIRRYADEGILPVNRTEGGHRRFKAQDVMRYIEPHTPVVAIYARSETDDQRGLQAIAESAGLRVAFCISERPVYVARPLPERPGFQKIAEAIAHGEIHGLLADSPVSLGGNVIAPWIALLRTLGLRTYILTRLGKGVEEWPK